MSDTLATPTRLAIYDMDRTITRYPTYTPFMLAWAARHRPWRLLTAPLVVACLLAYVGKWISRGRLKTLMLALLVGRPSAAQLQPAIDRFVDRLFDNGVYAGALAQIAADKAAGARVILATASYDFYVDDIAARLGVSEIVATRSVWDAQQRILPAINGENCYGPAKLAMVLDYLAAEGLDRAACHVTFYSDHHSDQPVFDWADVAVATNPNSRLRALAQSRGWRIIDWD